jgi:hypothetical protein
MRIADNRRRAAWIGLPLLAALFALLVLPPLASTNAPQSVAQLVPTTPSPSQNLCGSLGRPYYYTYESGKESDHAFGRPVTHNVKAELTDRLCGYVNPATRQRVGGDEALLRALSAMADGTDANRVLTPEQQLTEARDFLSRLVWRDSYLVLQAARPKKPLWTLFMVGTPGSPPRIHDYWMPDTPESTYLEIPVRRHDGKIVVLKLRRECGFQPVYYNRVDMPKGLA